jgi:dihydroorotate dehydrogenase subfamily 2
MEADPNVWVGIITANTEGQEKPVFCAGADLKAINSGQAGGLGTKRGGFAGFVYRERKKPVIVAVDGLATAGGCEIVLAADLVVCTTRSSFGLAEVKRNLIAGAGGLFRLPRDHAVINRMGFNNKGVEEVIKNLKDRNKRDGLIVGGNIGKNKITPNENAIEDYILALNALHPFVDYFVVNVSSPNTPNLRELQEKEPLKDLLIAVKKANSLFEIQRPILLKIAPDLSDSQLDDIIEIMQETKLDGLVATNTTIDRGGLKTKKESVDNIGAGGLSGKPLAQRSTEVIRYLHKHSKGSFPIIGVGGIHSVEDALEKLEAGAQLLQIYTGFIYEGPALIAKINRAILKHSK